MTRHSRVWKFYELKLMSHVVSPDQPSTTAVHSITNLRDFGSNVLSVRMYVSLQWQRPFMEYNP